VQVLVYRGLDRVAVEQAAAGDIVLLTGLEEIAIGDTITDPESPDPLPRDFSPLLAQTRSNVGNRHFPLTSRARSGRWG